MEQNNTPHNMHESLDVFDDEFAADDFDMVADGFGFAPGRVTDDGHSRRGSDPDPPIRSVAAHMADAPMTSHFSTSEYRPNRNSIRKSREMENPFRSAEDEWGRDNNNDDDDDDDEDGESAFGRTPSIRSQSTAAFAPGITHRSLSSTSSRAFAPSQTPLQAGRGPSHPYAMYPQGASLARTLSMSTVSTIRAPQRTLLANTGPTHPYSMYPQNVSEDADDASDHATPQAHAQIPVGFPGRTQAFHRQTGPEGEEQDIIGVDGHTEQLPPYSEYPEDGAPKHIVIPSQTATAALPATTQLSVPLIPRRPQSMSDAGNRPSAQPFSSMEQMESNESIVSSPKRWRDKSWKEKRKTKFFGVPFWWILLSLSVVAFIAIVLGAAIGGFMGSQKKSNHNQSKQPMLPATSSLIDASPIPTSSSGNPPATGTYALSLGTAEATQAACLTNQTYASAWGCDMSGPQALAINIQNPPSGVAGWEGASLLNANNSTGSYVNVSYGTQPPSTTFSQFIAVNDNDDLAQGPAFYFQAFYDKVVIVPSSALPSPSSTSKKRDIDYILPAAWFTRHQVAAGEQPWFCYWNGTFIEGFIYANNHSTTSASSHGAASPTVTSSPTSSKLVSYTTTSLVQVSGASGISTSTVSFSTSTYAQAWASNPPSVKRGVNYNQLPQLNHLVKIEERRLPNSPAPYCQKMQILDDGTAGVVSDPNGKPIVINLGEQDPSYSAYSSGSSSKMKRNDLVSGGCHCQWWSGQT